MNTPKRSDFLRKRKPAAAARHTPPELDLGDMDACPTCKGTGKVAAAKNKSMDTVKARALGRV